MLGRTGDHSVRDDRESDRIKAYIENKPVKAGLVANAEDSSLVERGIKICWGLRAAALAGVQGSP